MVTNCEGIFEIFLNIFEEYFFLSLKIKITKHKILRHYLYYSLITPEVLNKVSNA